MDGALKAAQQLHFLVRAFLEVHTPYRAGAPGKGDTVLDEAGHEALRGEFLRAERAREEAPLIPGGL